jgi:carbon storage regulator
VLILTRKRNEQILIGDQIQVTVIAVRGSYVRLGIEAPRHIAVNREEVLQQMREAANCAPRGRGAANGAQRKMPRDVQLPLPFPEE